MAEAPAYLDSQIPPETRRIDWIARVNSLINQIAEWSRLNDWPTERHEKAITERLLGTYKIPELIVRPNGGELLINPIGLSVSGGNGRVDLEAIPTLSRVKLIGMPQGWQILTDSNVPLRIEWDQETFVRLVKDLLD